MPLTAPASSSSTLITSTKLRALYKGSDCVLQPEPACLPWLQHPIVVGLSGGRDSVALLCMLVAWGCAVQACHVHHGIRGEEADADAAFCADLCAALNIRLHTERVDVPALAAARGTSLETTARVERRRIMKQVADRAGACVSIALAHHADDQAETIIFRLARGAAGLRGMRPVHRAEGHVWLRPLLGCTRAQITDFLRSIGQPWREDSTNAVADVVRNRLRLEVLPALNRAMGRDVTPIINRSARLHEESLDALEIALSQLPLTDPQGRLYLPTLLDKPAAYRKAVIRRFLHRHGVSGVCETMVLQVDAILNPTAPTSRLDLPAGLRAVRRQKRLIIEPVQSGEDEA